MGPTAGSQPPTPPYEAFFYTGSLVDSLFNTISTPRLGKYLTLADEDRTLAIQLYTWNIALSASLYGTVQRCEITLRNAINDALVTPFGEFWFDEPFMRPDQVVEIASIRKKFADRKKTPSAPDIVAATTMGNTGPTALYSENKDELHMLKMQPISIAVEGENSYRVRFQTDTGEISEYSFSIDNSNGFDLVVCEMAFLEITNGDPAADRVKECIGVLHEARHFEYAPKLNATAGRNTTS